MESATLPRRPPALPEILRFGLLGLLVLLALAGWAVTDERMHGMDAGAGTDLGTLGFYLTTWVVMMSAMMFPSIAPMVTAEQRLRFVTLLSQAAEDAGLPADPEFRAAIMGYAEWGSRLALHNSGAGAQVAEQAPMPRWSGESLRPLSRVRVDRGLGVS
ncbi:MAG TPA: DUF2182 domain-containing protein [Solirubrobacterales bacterium]|nr:DUF2182 domain-containing protein [Solirubrobacterales bacterium]